MAQSAAHIERPVVLGAVFAALAVAALLCVGGFVLLWMARPPLVVVTASDRLATALEKAPWVDSGIEGPVVWAIVAAGCADCGPFLLQDVPALQEDGLAVRLILYAPEDAAEDDVRAAVDMARTRAGADALEEPGEAEGYLEWGRASAREIDSVLAENGARLQSPALIWRGGGEWRVILGRDLGASARLAADLKPAA